MKNARASNSKSRATAGGLAVTEKLKKTTLNVANQSVERTRVLTRPKKGQAGEGQNAGSDTSSTPSFDDFGLKLREYRETHGFTLKHVASLAQISVGILSQIERGINSPSLKTVEKVRNALGLQIGFFFSDSRTPLRQGKALESVICRREERPKFHLNHNDISKELLHHGTSRVFEMMVITVPPGGGTRNSCYPSEKGGMVLEGLLELTVNDETSELREGDSFMFDGNQTHNIVNRTSTTAKVMWIVARLPNELLL